MIRAVSHGVQHHAGIDVAQTAGGNDGARAHARRLKL